MSIEADFFAHMAAAFPTVEIAYPGVNFKPTTNQWIELMVFRNESIDGASPSFTPAERGTLQAVAVTRNGSGILAPLVLADQIKAALPYGTKFTQGLQTSNTPNILTAIVAEDKIMLPVSVRYST